MVFNCIGKTSEGLPEKREKWSGWFTPKKNRDKCKDSIYLHLLQGLTLISMALLVLSEIGMGFS